MKVLIEIDEGLYQEILDNAMFAPKIIPDVKWAITSAMVNGIPLNGTNGEVLKAVFPNESDFETDFDEDWWNAEYKGGGVMYGSILVNEIEVICYPNNDGGFWYFDPTTGKIIEIEG